MGLHSSNAVISCKNYSSPIAADGYPILLLVPYPLFKGGQQVSNGYAAVIIVIGTKIDFYQNHDILVVMKLPVEPFSYHPRTPPCTYYSENSVLIPLTTPSDLIHELVKTRLSRLQAEVKGFD